MDKISIKISWTFFFAVIVTVVVNAVCLVLQHFSIKRMLQTEAEYHRIQAEEMEMKRDLDDGVRKKCKKQRII